MFRLWCVILPTVSSLYFASASTDWDVAVASTKFIDLIKHDGSENPVERIPFNENILHALAFNPIERQLYFSDSNDTENCIFRMNVETKKIQPLVTKVNGNCNIKDITYDTVTNTLYWLSDYEIRYLNLNNQQSPQTGTVFIAVDKSEEKLSCLSIDICNKKLYWISVNPMNNIDFVQNCDLDGKNKKVLTTVSDKHLPLSIQVDQNTGRVYWMEESKVNSFMYIKSLSPFDDNKVVDIHLSEAKGHQPISFTLFDSKFFWVDSTNNAIYVAEKKTNDISSTRLPIKYNSKNEQLRSIASVNYLDLAQCNKSKNQNNRVPTDVEKQYEGVHVPPKVNLETKESKNTLLCLNDGKQSFGQCVCEDGFTGTHCEISLCYNFCLNNKLCTIENNKPKCDCGDDFHGERCDKPVIKVPPKDSPSNCSCPELLACKNVSDDITNSTSITLLSASFNKDNVSLMKGSMDNPDCNTNLWLMLVIGILAVICILLMMLSAILMSKVLSLRKRPRIKKRIIVNKNTTPLTARPQATEQCEITIENCCNMNICETPCFEPQLRTPLTAEECNNSKRSSKKDKKKEWKDEKQNLLSGIDLPSDDLY